MKNYTYWHGDKGVNETGCACAEDKSCASLDGAPIECNCDDEKTGITDNNLLTSKSQLPVKGKVSKKDLYFNMFYF